MKTTGEKIPNPKELEKEIGEFLAKKFGDNIKIVSPMVLPQEVIHEKTKKQPPEKRRLNFDLKPQDLISYLDQYVVRQSEAKAVLATKICTHFNRVKRADEHPEAAGDMVGSIKNNVLMIGPTGVGKTYLVKLIAHKIGVPFVKGDATKFSETGYVGGDVEDLVRDLVRAADDDIELAQYGIIYIDEIDKIASSHNFIGADVSRTGVQRALLKPMEETEVDLKVPHDPISMFQEIERYRKTGSREKRTVNTRNILFIMSGAFAELPEIIHKRIARQAIGFGAAIQKSRKPEELLRHVRSEDLVAYGFESEFVGRLPVRCVFDPLEEKDLLEILQNPNNPVILGKKLDFAAYGIAVKFSAAALAELARRAAGENTGARGLVSAVERALLPFERSLPSTRVKHFAVAADVIQSPRERLEALVAAADRGDPDPNETFERLAREEKQAIVRYLKENIRHLSEKHSLTLTDARMEIVATFYAKQAMDMERVLRSIKSFYDEIKNIELSFYKRLDINIVLEEGAIDFIIEKIVAAGIDLRRIHDQLIADFELGLKLVREKTGKNRFFITREALLAPEEYIGALIRDEMKAK